MGQGRRGVGSSRGTALYELTTSVEQGTFCCLDNYYSRIAEIFAFNSQTYSQESPHSYHKSVSINGIRSDIQSSTTLECL